MTDRLARAAADILDARRTGTLIEPWSEAQKPVSIEEAYAIQEAVAAQCGLTPAGWKLGCTSEISQRNLGSNGPIVGRMFAEHILPSGTVISDARPDMLIVEAEFVFTVGADLVPRVEPYGRDEVLAALDALYPGIELVQSWFRVSRMPINEMIADNSGFGRSIIGSRIDDWRSLDLPAASAAMVVDGDVRGSGHGRDVLGDPVTAMVWLANFLSRRGIPLCAGEFVTTGTCTGVAFLRPRSEAVADFGPLGRVTAQFV